MNKKGSMVLWIVIFLVALGAVIYFLMNNPPDTSSSNSNSNSAGGSISEVGNIVHMTDSGYSPSPLTINQGDTVTWVNDGTVPNWPASAMHPTHTVYPGSDIEKCGTSEQSTIFDACEGIQPGESWSFTFNEVGTWNYHNHMVAGQYGKVIVQ